MARLILLVSFYFQGAAIIRMLEDVLGRKVFFEGLQKYLKKYSFSNAETNDLWRSLTQESMSRQVNLFFPKSYLNRSWMIYLYRLGKKNNWFYVRASFHTMKYHARHLIIFILRLSLLLITYSSSSPVEHKQHNNLIPCGT